jgi:CheY-like chemotaxis protein
LGIGLSIVKQLIELHGGTVVATSQGADKGSTFVIKLPLAPVRPNGNREHPKTPKHGNFDCEGIDLDGIKVLIVDDEPDARELVRRVLAQCGAEVVAAGSAAEGIEQLRSFKPHVLVSDIGMPGTDGYQFMRSVRGLPVEEGGKTPAIALTAFARSEDRMQAMMAGYQVHVAKPIEPQELVVTVNMLRSQIPAI